MDGYVIVADGNGVFCSWQHWVDSAALYAAVTSDAGRAILRARDMLLETSMDVSAEPFAGQAESRRAYQVVLPAKTADPLRARVTIRVKDAPLATFLDIISRQTGLNLILADGLEGVRVTVFLNNVTAREALELLRATKGLTYQWVESKRATLIAPAARRPSDFRTTVNPQDNAPSGER